MWRTTGFGIKPKPTGDVGGKLRDFTGSTVTTKHRQITARKKDTPPEDVFQHAGAASYGWGRGIIL